MKLDAKTTVKDGLASHILSPFAASPPFTRADILNNSAISSFILSESNTNNFSLAGAALVLRPAVPVVARVAPAPTLTVLSGGLGTSGGAGGTAGATALGSTFVSIGVAAASLGVAGGVYYMETHGGAVDIYTYYGDLFYDWMYANNPAEEKNNRKRWAEQFAKANPDIPIATVYRQFGLDEKSTAAIKSDANPSDSSQTTKAGRGDLRALAPKEGTASPDNEKISDLKPEELFRRASDEIGKLPIIEDREAQTISVGVICEVISRLDDASRQKLFNKVAGLLDFSNSAVRYYGVVILKRITRHLSMADRSRVVQKLKIMFTEDPDPSVQDAAFDALSFIAPFLNPSERLKMARFFERALKNNRDPQKRYDAIWALRSLTPYLKKEERLESTLAVAKRLVDRVEKVRNAALSALDNMRTLLEPEDLETLITTLKQPAQRSVPQK